MDRLRLLFAFLLLVMASACTPLMPPVEAPVDEQAKDEGLFLRGLSFLSESLQKNDYSAVKYHLATLINDHPTSKWRDNAYMLLHLIEELESYRDKLRDERDAIDKTLADKAKTLQENEQLKKDIRLLNEKFQAELTALQQENEQLKKDLQLLKNLEMQLDKREKMLR